MTKRLHIITMPLVISLILPTFNEAQNLPSLLSTIEGVLRGTEHEVLIVDDNSPDGTWQVAQMLAKDYPTLRVIRRLGKKGLSSAVVDGFDAARGDTLIVMDADGQHDSELLLKFITAIQSGADIVVGSRYMPGGSVGEWIRDRRIISKTGTFLSNWLSGVPVSDPLAGFFAIKTSLYRSIRERLRPSGFKILLEVLANIPKTSKVTEVPLIFRMRLHGESKLSFAVHCQFLFQLIRLSLKVFWHKILHTSRLWFWLAVAVTLVLLLPRVWSLRMLYTDSALREKVRTAITAVGIKEGWMLSNITLTGVSADKITILYDEHRRQHTKAVPCTITLATNDIECAN